MNGLFGLENSNDLFEKAKKDYLSFCNDPNDNDLYNLLILLNHLRDWIYPQGYKAYEKKKISEYTKEQAFHSKLYQNESYKIINKLCNNFKHYNNLGKKQKTEILDGFFAGFNRCGDSLGQRNYLVNGKDLRDVIHEVFHIYKNYFTKS